MTAGAEVALVAVRAGFHAELLDDILVIHREVVRMRQIHFMTGCAEILLVAIVAFRCGNLVGEILAQIRAVLGFPIRRMHAGGRRVHGVDVIGMAVQADFRLTLRDIPRSSQVKGPLDFRRIGRILEGRLFVAEEAEPRVPVVVHSPGRLVDLVKEVTGPAFDVRVVGPLFKGSHNRGMAILADEDGRMIGHTRVIPVGLRVMAIRAFVHDRMQPGFPGLREQEDRLVRAVTGDAPGFRILHVQIPVMILLIDLRIIDRPRLQLPVAIQASFQRVLRRHLRLFRGDVFRGRILPMIRDMLAPGGMAVDARHVVMCVLLVQLGNLFMTRHAGLRVLDHHVLRQDFTDRIPAVMSIFVKALRPQKPGHQDHGARDSEDQREDGNNVDFVFHRVSPR